MSCNGCRVLRKGCSDNCILKECLQWIESPQAQAHATLFVAKFFGRAGLMSFISAVPQHQRPALFQSLLYEAVGRTVNPVNGAVGLLWTGNWHACQSALETVLRGGALGPLSEAADQKSADNAGSDIDHLVSRRPKKRPITNFDDHGDFSPSDLDLCLMAGRRRSSSSAKMVEKIRAATPSEESETTTLASSSADSNGARSKLLRLFM